MWERGKDTGNKVRKYLILSSICSNHLGQVTSSFWALTFFFIYKMEKKKQQHQTHRVVWRLEWDHSWEGTLQGVNHSLNISTVSPGVGRRLPVKHEMKPQAHPLYLSLPLLSQKLLSKSRCDQNHESTPRGLVPAGLRGLAEPGRLQVVPISSGSLLSGVDLCMPAPVACVWTTAGARWMNDQTWVRGRNTALTHVSVLICKVGISLRPSLP